MSQFVLDSSVTMAWCFQDEKTSDTEALLKVVSEGDSAVVPSLWSYEVLNVLVQAQRQNRITSAHAHHFWRELQNLSIRMDDKYPEQSSHEIMTLAGQYRLSAYDASYLELALREGLPLATLDEGLKRAAKAAGVPTAHP